jgi:UDP-GlcNAc:undecaprenyl-phosphate GlcNAc-1-phosphate transferase
MLLCLILASLSAALVRLMMSLGALDHPVERSSHTRPTPKGGGVGIVAAYVAGMAWLLHTGQAGLHPLVTAPAALFLAVVSYFDDLRDWPFVAKLLAQLAASCAVLVAGAAATLLLFPGNGMVVIPGAVAVALSLGWLLFVTNAVNFIDGLNGLASGSIALAAIALAAGVTGSIALQAAVLAAGIVGFLPFNYPRAKIFMGDVGSQVIGFLAADLALQAAPHAAVSLIVPLALLPLLADAAFTLLRRARRGERVTQAHRGHLYQVANRAGMPGWQVTMIYWSMAAWGGALGLTYGAFGNGLAEAAPVVVLDVAPILAWGVYVRWIAKRAGLTVW